MKSQLQKQLLVEAGRKWHLEAMGEAHKALKLKENLYAQLHGLGEIPEPVL